MLVALMETSIFVLLIRKLGKGHRYPEQRPSKIYKNSRTYRVVRKNWDMAKTYFRYSFLGKLTEIKDEGNIAVLYGSVVVKKSIDLYKKYINRLSFYSKTSRIDNLTGQLKKNLYSLPIKTISIIVIAAIVTNIFFSILLKKEVTFLGWFIRVLLFFAALIGLSSGTKWDDMKETSFVTRYINNCCKIKD